MLLPVTDRKVLYFNFYFLLYFFISFYFVCVSRIRWVTRSEYAGGVAVCWIPADGGGAGRVRWVGAESVQSAAPVPRLADTQTSLELYKLKLIRIPLLQGRTV